MPSYRRKKQQRKAPLAEVVEVEKARIESMLREVRRLQALATQLSYLVEAILVDERGDDVPF